MALLSNLRINDKVISTIPKPTDINVEGLTLHLARYTALENTKAINCVNEKLLLHCPTGHHEKVRAGSHYDFYGSSEVVESENLVSIEVANGTLDGINYSISNGVITLNGTTPNMTVTLRFKVKEFTIPTSIGQGGKGCFYIYNSQVVNSGSFVWMYGNSSVDGWGLSATNRVSSTYVGMGGKVANGINIVLPPNTNVNMTFKPMFSNDGNVYTEYKPYFEPYIKNKGVKNEFVRANALEKTTINTNTGKTESSDTYVTSEFIKVSSGITYCRSSGNVMHFYNTNKEWISSPAVGNPFTIPSGASYMRVVVSYVNLPNFVMVKGNVVPSYYIPSNNHYYLPFNNTLIDLGDEGLRQGEVRSTDGRRTISRAVVDLGTLNWTRTTTTNRERFAVSGIGSPISNALGYENNEIANVVCPNYVKATPNDTYYHRGSKIISIGLDKTLYIYDEALISLSASDFKTAMSGVILEYDLATPTTQILETYEFESGLLGADNETPRYKLDYNYVESIECKSSNLLDDSQLKDNFDKLMTNFSKVNHTITFTNSASARAYIRYYVELEKGTYNVSLSVKSGVGLFYVDDYVSSERDWNLYSKNVNFTDGNPKDVSITFTITKNSSIRFMFAVDTSTLVFDKIMLIKGSVKPTTFVPYFEPKTKQLNLAILNNGSLVNNLLSNEYAIVNAWEINWSYQAVWGANNTFYVTTNSLNMLNLGNDMSHICNLFETISATDMYANRKNGIANNGNFLRISANEFTDVATFKAYLQANNVKFIYKLANKIEYDIDTPSTPTALECNVNADSKGVAIEYAKQN